MTKICQCRFVSCNKCTALVETLDNREGYVCFGAGSIWDISVLSAQFCCERKIALNIKKKKKHFCMFSFLKKMTEKKFKANVTGKINRSAIIFGKLS